MNKTSTFLMALLAAASISMHSAKDCKAQVWASTPAGNVFGLTAIMQMHDNYYYNPPAIIMSNSAIIEPAVYNKAPHYIPEPAKPADHWQKYHLEYLLRER